MEKTKVLYVTQEMKPYLQLTEIAEIAHLLPQYMQENGMEIRVLMPRFGIINERRHRLHEVVRLSGINIIIDQDDYPLIIKVASLPGARIQVYFLENEDFFKRKAVFGDKSKEFFDDNAERMLFFCKGVLETVKKFGWAPDIVHCHGWMTSLLPLYLKTAYKNEPVFNKSKVIYSLYKSANNKLPGDFLKKAPLIHKKVNEGELEYFKESTIEGLDKGAISKSDGIIIGSDELSKNIEEFISTINKPVLKLEGEADLQEEYKAFYEQLLQKK